jgi:hypothetical protein
MVTWRGRGGEAVEMVEPMMAMARRTSTMAGRAVRREVKTLGAPPAVAHAPTPAAMPPGFEARDAADRAARATA